MSFFRRKSGEENRIAENRVNKPINEKKEETDFLKEHEKEINFEMTLKCYNYCVKSFMEKILNPYEKECMYHCYQNLTNFYIEVHNSLTEKEQKPLGYF